MDDVIIMSFGYYDNEWIDPPESEYDSESGEILVEFQNDVFNWIGGSMEFQNGDRYTDFYEEDSLVADKDTIEEYVLEALEPYLPEYEDEGYYKISGWVSIPFDIYYKGKHVAETELDGDAFAGEIEIEPVDM